MHVRGVHPVVQLRLLFDRRWVELPFSAAFCLRLGHDVHRLIRQKRVQLRLGQVKRNRLPRLPDLRDLLHKRRVLAQLIDQADLLIEVELARAGEVHKLPLLLLLILDEVVVAPDLINLFLQVIDLLLL